MPRHRAPGLQLTDFRFGFDAPNDDGTYVQSTWLVGGTGIASLGATDAFEQHIVHTNQIGTAPVTFTLHIDGLGTAVGQGQIEVCDCPSPAAALRGGSGGPRPAIGAPRFALVRRLEASASLRSARRGSCIVPPRADVSPRSAAMVGRRLRAIGVLSVAWLLCVLPLAAQQPPLTQLQFDIVGVRLVVDPPVLTVPKNIATQINTSLALPPGSGAETRAAIDTLTDGAIVEAELRGPDLPPTRIVTRAGPADSDPAARDPRRLLPRRHPPGQERQNDSRCDGARRTARDHHSDPRHQRGLRHQRDVAAAVARRDPRQGHRHRPEQLPRRSASRSRSTSTARRSPSICRRRCRRPSSCSSGRRARRSSSS